MIEALKALAEDALGTTMWNSLEAVIDRTPESVHPTIPVEQDGEIRAWSPEWPPGVEVYEVQYESSVHDEVIRELASHGFVVLPNRDRRRPTRASSNRWLVAPSGAVPREVVQFE